MSVSGNSLGQLLDMGIPRGRALAALKRSKDDAMAAAERVFSGEFDDIASDDEGSPAPTTDAPNGLRTPDSASQAAGSEDDVPMASDEEEYMDEEEDDGFELDEFMEDDGAAACLDPYANVFFSKERTETLLEPALESIYAQIAVPKGQGDDGGDTLRLRILSRGEWMSGCPEGNEQSFLFQLYEKLSSGTFACPNGCGHEFERAPQDFFALFPDFPAYTSHLERHIQRVCPKCGEKVCSACEDTIRAATKAKHSPTDTQRAEAAELFHCPAVQGAILGVALHMIEQESGGQLRVEAPANSPPSKKRKTSALGKLLNSMQGGDDDSDDSELSYGLGAARGKPAPKGTGYSGNSKEDRTGEIAAEKSQFLKDQRTAILLSEVRAYLPAVRRGHTTDLLVHPTALAHLRRRSSFVNDLLRNDSLMDMSNRAEIYHALFDWLEVVSSHEVLASMLAMPQMRAVKAVPSANDPNNVEVTYEGAPSPRELLETVVIQATAALKGLSSTTAPKESDHEVDEQALLQQSVTEAKKKKKEKEKETARSAANAQNALLAKFCDRILDARSEIDRLLVATKGRAFVDRMLEQLPRLYESDADQPAIEHSATDETTLKVYEEWAQRVRFRYCDLHDANDPSKVKYAHAYDSNLQGLVGTNAPKRSLAIAKELAILTTSLPAAWGSTIFLRVDDARVDCIKAMIIGPEGTPYENGCFLFDIFLPLDYNYSCPSVKSMTTNGGKFRYNPNLYADGKVCLSLLGTWSGPGWIAGKSTLLQVLISIQSLILCDEPYLNEPGWANQAGTASSKAYSANVKRMVVMDAMANNLENPPFPFENEIKTHFRLKSKAIRAQLERWKAEDDGKAMSRESYGLVGGVPAKNAGSSSKTAFDSGAERLLKLLDELDPESSATKSQELKVEATAGTSAEASGSRTGATGGMKKKTASKPKQPSKATRSSSRLKTKK